MVIANKLEAKPDRVITSTGEKDVNEDDEGAGLTVDKPDGAIFWSGDKYINYIGELFAI